MNFRPPLDPSFYLSTGGNTTTTSFVTPTVFYAYQPDVPSLYGSGPPDWSTSGELVPDPPVIHDVNCYYRALGFSWPFTGITRRDLRDAYIRTGGPDDAWKTYAYKILLNREIRRQYDRMPFGLQMMDHYMWTEIRRRATEFMNAARTQGYNFTEREVLEDWGVPFEDNPDEAELPSDDGPSGEVDAQKLEEPSGDGDTFTWPWGYYLWRSRCSDVQRLSIWQDLLLQTARRVGLRAHLGVGFAGRLSREWVIGRVVDYTVIFLSEHAEPDEEMAAQAVHAVMTDTR